MLARIAEQFPELRVFREQRARQWFEQRDDGFMLIVQGMDLCCQNPQPEVFLRRGQRHGRLVGFKRFATVGECVQGNGVIDAGKQMLRP